MEDLKEFIEKYTELPDADWTIIQKAFKRKVVEQNEVLLEDGSTCKHFYFLEKGLFRFYFNKDGDDITKTFVIAPYCFTSKISFRNQQSAPEGIQAIENSIIWQVDYEQFNLLMELNSWNRFIRKLANEVQDFTESLLIEVKTETAEMRYKKLLENYPADLIQKIPLKHLSTFLGIAPQSLSRIRKKLHENRNKLT